MDPHVRQIPPSGGPDRYSSSLYSSNSAGVPGAEGGSADEGDVEDVTLQDQSYTSKVSAQNGNGYHSTPENSAKHTEGKAGKKKLSRDSFKNMGRAIEGALAESALTKKIKKHRGKHQKYDVNSPQSDEIVEEGEPGIRLETIQDYDDDNQHDDINDEVNQHETRAFNTTDAARFVEPVQSTHVVMSPSQEEEVSLVDPEVLTRQREMEKTPCASILLLCLFIAGMVLGIILCAMIPLGPAFQILGPIFLGLSGFALVYKFFVTVLWKEDPYRYCLGKIRKCCNYRPRK